ncbi:MAG: hypothetical protein IT374_14885 [Polyangiaceae bacterium]|nr:hypothetical protein [Polyangiaceae bacterium]
MAIKNAKPAGKPKATDKPSKQSFAAAKPASDSKKAKAAPADDDQPKRALGLRGAAPWAARHAAKHAAEARKRAAEPPPPGSARATIRTPVAADEIKAQIAELFTISEKLRAMKKTLPKTFFDVGLMLRDVQARKLFTAKGFQSFEAFVEREIDLGKTLAVRLVKMVGLFQREAVMEMGMDRALEMMGQLEGERTSESRLPASKPQIPVGSMRGPIVGR